LAEDRRITTLNKDSMKYSIVIPFYNEEENAAAVLKEVLDTNPEAEVIAVDDGSKDGTLSALQKFSPRVRVLAGTANRGQSSAMYAGMKAARCEWVALMDGDGQNDPADFPKLRDELAKSGCDFVCGYRAVRKDTTSRRLASRAANAIRRMFLNDGVRDTGCSLKMMRKECVEHLLPFNGMHRYIPALLLQAGYRFSEVPVNHRGRMAGVSKYTNWERARRGIYDLFGVSWILKRKVRFDTVENALNEESK
jgi:dolichol-phosphate mannosyltransferase